MPSNRLQKISIFRQQLYSAIHYRADAALDLIDALCSNTTAKSPVELSLNHHHRRTYNSITDALSEFHCGEDPQKDAIQSLLYKQINNNNGERPYYLFAIDVTPAPRKHSPTLTDCSIIYSPNPVQGNKPISIGHKYSTLCFLPDKDEKQPPWILPLDVKRVATDSDDTTIAAAQLTTVLSSLCQSAPGRLNVQVVDNGCSKPEYIAKIHEGEYRKNIVTIVRARSNRVFWCKATEKHSRYGNNRGHELWYGDKFALKDTNSWHNPDEAVIQNIQSKSGKQLTVTIKSWHNMLSRQKKGIAMNNHPFTLVRIEVTNEQGSTVFHKPMWVCVYGERRLELNSQQIYQSYLQRYDIEHYFKFDKRNLLTDNLQTPDTQHEENWWFICMLAYAMLFVSRKVISKNPRDWEKYLPEMKNKNRIATPSMVQRQFNQITKAIGTPALPPKARGRSLGRITGAVQSKRNRYSVIVKSKISKDLLTA